MEIRNIAIIAHVDHGKTTLTDAILKQNGMTEEGASMDSNALEQERGITIYAKNTSLFYKGTKINIVDTPGHADFGSEVERVLRSIDTVLLIVDAQEGPMPQTRFVLKKSLELGFNPIVVINKIDKPAARPKEAEEEIRELFLELGANDTQFNFVPIYAIGRLGIAKNTLEEDSKDLTPLLDRVLKDVPNAVKNPDATLVAQVFNLGYDNFLGRTAIARVYEGKVKAGTTVFIKKPTGEVRTGKISKLFTFEGTKRKETEEATSGDIVAIAGLPDIYIGETIATHEATAPMHAIAIDEPTITLDFLVNNSPFAGREGKYVTGRQIRERLEKELEINVGLRIDFSSNEVFKVSGRGELHIGILLENMRREGFELQVSQPQVIIKEVDGQKMEPYEELVVDIREETTGTVIEKLGRRKGIMTDMKTKDGLARMTFDIPTRGLLGFRSEFMIDTKGEGILSSRFIEFRPFAGEIKKRPEGAMVSMVLGKAVGYAIYNLQERGMIYIEEGTETYPGMVIGNTSKGDLLEVNPTKGKQLTNVRSSGNDEAVIIIPPWTLTIERGLEIITGDEYLEITPKSIRLRKKPEEKRK